MVVALFICLFFIISVTGVVASNLGTKAERDIRFHCWGPQHEISRELNEKYSSGLDRTGPECEKPLEGLMSYTVTKCRNYLKLF